MTHNDYAKWIERFWRYGALDGYQRDDLLYRLNVAREDYHTIRTTMEHFAQYLPAKSRAAWGRAQAQEGIE